MKRIMEKSPFGGDGGEREVVESQLTTHFLV
jgi:hypothetical protein